MSTSRPKARRLSVRSAKWRAGYHSAFKDLNAAEIETLNGLLLRVFANL
ncbi:MAG: hypothetical protein ACJ8R9_31000 [Steroidobacteraceae bacterium]